MGEYRYRENVKRGMAFVLAIILGGMAFLPGFPVFPAKAAPASGQQTTLTTAHGDTLLGHKLYCIDKGGYAIWGIAEKGDLYEAHCPSQASVPLSSQEQKYVFWAMLSLRAALGDEKANTFIRAINVAAKAQGKPEIIKMVSEEDLKTILYVPAVRAKYPWLEAAASNSEAYMQMGGMLSGGGSGKENTGVGGGKIPDVIASSTSLGTAKQVDAATLTLSFAPDGSDWDFIRSVPLEFSNNDGVSFSPVPTDGWTYTKTDSQIIFKNPNPKPSKALIRFRVEGTPYALGGGGYASAEEAIDQSLQIWECVTCSGTHGGGTPAKSDPWIHQRMAWMELGMVPVNYFAELAGDPTPVPEQGGIQFEVFRHEEDFTSTYNLQMYKYDHETGKALEGARFGFFERFDDKNRVNTERDGAAELYEGGEPYASHYQDEPVLWDGFRQVGSAVTDGDGYASQTVEHGYHYDKTFCDGHPAPTFVPVPEEEEDEEGEVINEDEIEAAQAENIRLANSWLLCEEECEGKAGGDFEGVHFHWMMEEVDAGEIEGIASDGGSEGETPDAGPTTGADGETSYAKSGCQEDCGQTYEKFISMKYSYTWKEFKARDGYILHDEHADDLPIEIITIDASEHGANAAFGGGYSRDVVLGTKSVRRSQGIGEASGNQNGESEAKAGISGKNGWERRSASGWTIRENLAAFLGKSPVFPGPLKMRVLPQRMVLFTALDAALLGKGTPSEAEIGEKSQDTGNKAGRKRNKTSENEQDINEKDRKLTQEKKEATASEMKVSISDHLVNRVQKGFVFIDEADDDLEEAEKAERESIRRYMATGSDLLTTEAGFYTSWHSPSLLYQNPQLSQRTETLAEAAAESLFFPAYESALVSASVGSAIEPGSAGNFSHCNGADGEKDAWRIYDHRTEGEVHINKKDLDLKQGENESYNALGDSQGDATLEGAVYGLFAAEDLLHPDGKTGVVYRANHLVAVATTDKNGDASFLACTEAPGRTYDYSKGSIVDAADGWRKKAPGNLYTQDAAIDDYTADKAWERIYYNNTSKNGNAWIGRPLLMGEYYVKELSRSEGFELSIGNKLHAVTNLGQDLEAAVLEPGEGYAHISMQMYGEEQAGDGGADTNEIFFSAESKDTKEGVYEIVVSGLPEGVSFYRKDEGKGTVSVEAGTGEYEKVYTGELAVAENDYQYPKYNADGTPMNKKVPIEYAAGWMRQVRVQELVPETVEAVLLQAETGMTEEENADKLAKIFDVDDFCYLKGKAERVLRRHAKITPRTPGAGENAYSSIYTGVFDRGVREGERDVYGVSGVTPGEKAEKTVYGSPVQTIAVPKTKDGISMTVGDVITSVLDFYHTHPYISYGGLDAVQESSDSFEFTVYAGILGIPENFMVLGSDPEKDSLIFHRAEWLPENMEMCPRYVYIPYSNNRGRDAFGTYTDYRETTAGNQVMASALLQTDAVIEGDGTIVPKKNEVNVYYKTGEIPYDADGQPIQVVVYREKTETQQREVTETKWVHQAAARNADGRYILRVNANFTDSFGVKKTNAGVLEELGFKAVLKEKKVTLNEEEAAMLGNGFFAGHQMNSSSYYTWIKQARAKAYVDSGRSGLTGDDSYVVPVALAYPGQETTYQDAGTRKEPLGVLERVIRQKIKIVKNIATTPVGTYAHNTYAESGHTDPFTEKEGGNENVASALPNFRFKLYLKSNLERLYRNTDGEIVWMNRDGEVVSLPEVKKNFPLLRESFAPVQKIFTQVIHKKDSQTAGSVNNNVWGSAVTAKERLYEYGKDGQIADSKEVSQGYTRLLETVMRTKEDGAGAVREVSGYQYEKFFDAMAVANRDKWQRADAADTSFKPFAWIRMGIFGTGGGEIKDPAHHNNAAIQNQSRTSEAAIENAKRSDAVRQFAMDWYLKDEVKKQNIQASGGQEGYPDYIYDEALHQAILKAEEYLKPFFSYDLDDLYAIEWDSAENGGSDRDKTTLSAEKLKKSEEGYYYGISKYLPYGTYVAVEQQPYSGALEDFKNQHYRIDQPKEIEVPSVYEAGGNLVSPEKKSADYQYDASASPETLAANYQIRMNEEWGDTNQADLRKYVIRAHGQDGTYEIYKYGLDADKRQGTISYPGGSYDYSGFSPAQREMAPYKDIYRSENANSRYRSNEKVESYYRYGSISEQAGWADSVEYPYGEKTDDNNPAGFYLKDHVRTITGALTGFDGRYFQGLVPYSVTEPAAESAYDALGFTGYADGKYRNTFYAAKLRIEKLDSETGENILHDDAVFAIYAASRDTSKYSEGEVQFYEKDTQVTASREFLEAMGAKKIAPVDLKTLIPSKYPWKAPYTGKYTGIIPAETPICSETDQVVMQDAFGTRTGTFRVYSTLQDFGGLGETLPSNQNTGYLITPQPLGAGAYVLCELSAPEGYVRTKPIAVEVYSDEVTYYRDGERGQRVAAAVYREMVTRISSNGEAVQNPDGTKPNGNKPQDRGDVARIYVGNTPIRLEIAKVKQEETEILFELSDRREGTLTELSNRYGLENLELAYNASGTFLGYGWSKGWLDSLRAKQEAGEWIDLIYEDQVFTGKAIWHRVPDTAHALNRYLPGALMCLYDAIEVKKNGDSEDRAYAGVNVVRDSFGNVIRMYVQKGYAGNRLLYVKDKEQEGEDNKGENNNYTRYTQDDRFNDQGKGRWILKWVEREDTDILYYDLGALEVFTTLRGVRYAYNEKGETVRPKDGEPIYAMKDGVPFLEIVSPSYEELAYSRKERRFEYVPSGTKFYHLASDGSRDSEVEPYTGMAYVTEEKTGKTLVWVVRVSKDRYENVIARDKIKTGRVATMYADTEQEYTIGTYDGGLLQPHVNPVLNENGLPVYYQRSDQTYIKGYPVYDRDGDYVRYRYSDLLRAYNANAWDLQLKAALYDIGNDPEKREDDRPLYHRQGEAYLMENSWITGDEMPNDPFHTRIGDGQVDVLKRVPVGTYILEETRALSGYAKRMPAGLTVEETCEVQELYLTNRPITVQIEKIDAPEQYQQPVRDYDRILNESDSKTWEEGKGGYTFSSVEGAVLALYPAKRVASDDMEAHPSGYYLEKKGELPANWTVLDERNQKKTVTAKWTVGKTPMVWEGMPAGDYILEEIETPPGYLTNQIEVEIQETSKLQLITMQEDHIKTAFFKYEEKDGKKECLPNAYAAELTLYEAVTDENGIVMEADGTPRYDREKRVTSWKTEDAKAYSQGSDSFAARYQKLYEEYHTRFNTVAWCGYTAEKLEETATEQGESVRQLWNLGNGSQVLVQVTKNLQPDGKAGYSYDFRWNYQTEGTLVSYDTSDGIHRIDYLPLNPTKNDLASNRKKGYYVLVETKTPSGYQKAAPKPVIVEETAEIQLYGLENRAKSVYISKLGSSGEASEEAIYLAGAELAVFRAAQDGSLMQEKEYLVERWISGSDGKFTEEEAEKQEIPAGWKAGDWKPHRISPIAYGVYYLVELSAPAGYRLMEPKKFTVAAASGETIEAVNTLKQGRVRVEKVDERKPEEKLAGAVFEVKNRETGEKVQMETDESGQAESPFLPIGTIGENGSWIPYHYEVRETMPPDGYQLIPRVYEVLMEDQKECEVLTYDLTVPNETTKIKISKLDFDTGLFVSGAKLAVYEAGFLDGVYTEAGEALETWICDGKTHVIEGKLIAGHTYLLKELEAPDGYTVQKPMIFTVSDTGRGINAARDGANALETETADGLFDSITSLQVQGRKALRLVRTLWDLDSGEEFVLSSLMEASVPYLEREKCEKEGVAEGHRFELREIIEFSDGSRRTIGKNTFRLNWDENGHYPLTLRTLKGTRYRLEEYHQKETDGREVESWIPENRDGLGYIHEIRNPEYSDPCGIRAVSSIGKDGAAVLPGSVIVYEITYRNQSDKKENMKIGLEIPAGCELMTAASMGGAEQIGESWYWNIENVAAGSGGILRVAVLVGEHINENGQENHSGMMVTATIWGKTGKSYESFHPILSPGAIAIAGRVTGTAAALLRQVDITYTLYLKNAEGKELPGLISYTGSKSGTLRSGGSLTLSCGESVVLTGMPWGTNYEVRAQVPAQTPDGLPIEWKSTGSTGRTSRQGNTVLWEFHQNDRSVREVLKRGNRYRLVELLELDGGKTEEVESNQMIFSLGDDAQIDGIGMIDSPTKLVFSKTDLGGTELPGAQIEILDQSGNVIESWISADHPHEIIGTLTPGKSYIMRETGAPDGFSYAEEIPFTVSEDGTVERISMQDKPTHVEITKYSVTGEKELPGARMELWEEKEGGTLVDSWVSDRGAHVIKGKLNAGKNYVLVEKTAPDGYWKAEKVIFTVSLDGRVDQVKMYDRPTEVQVEKRKWREQKGDSEFVKGAHLRISDETGKVILEWISEEKEKCIQGILKEGCRYILEELEAPEGYEKAEPVSFTVLEGGTVTVVRMYDRLKPEKPGRPGHGQPEHPKKVIEELKEGYLTVHVPESICGDGKIVLDGRQMKPLPKMGYGESATWEVEGAYQVEDEKERLNEAISLIWKWKLVIGLICMSAGAGLALAERRRKEENIKKNMERNDKGKEE